MDGFGESHSPRPRLPLSRFSAEQKGKAPATPDNDDHDIEAGQSSWSDSATASGSSDPMRGDVPSEKVLENSARGGEVEASGSFVENQHTEMEIEEAEQFGNDYPHLSDREEDIEDSEAHDQKEMDDAVQGMRRIFTTLMWREAEEQLPGIALPFVRRV